MNIGVCVGPRSIAALFSALTVLFVQAGHADQPLTLGGVTLGTSIEAVTHVFGAPGLVQTTDDGHEWRWFDAAGLDVDLLVDNALTVRQVLVSRPEDVHGMPAKLVQPREFPVLEQTSSGANVWMKSSGATREPEPENSVSAWRVAGGLVVLELRDGQVRKILGLDTTSAAHLGYIPGPKAPPYRSPRLLRQFPVDYPKRAVERRAEGVVVVAVDLASSGSVRSVRVIVSSGDADLDAAEVLSMRKSRFAPARCDGEPCDGIYLDREEYTLGP
jgi:TonB family protein